MIKKDPQRISKPKAYVNQYNWKDIKFPSDKEDFKKFEQNNKEIALNVLFVSHNKTEMEPAYTSRNKLVSEPSYHLIKRFSENLLAIEMKKNKSKNK